jgi:MFS family permease
MTLWHGAISDRFGRRRVILVALACSPRLGRLRLATRIEQLWFWRAMQGVTPAPASSSAAPSSATFTTAPPPSA